MSVSLGVGMRTGVGWGVSLGVGIPLQVTEYRNRPQISRMHTDHPAY